MKIFMDNVPTLVIQASIVRKIPELFSPKTVSDMSDDVVKKIAEEPEDKVSQREELLSRLEILEKGARICREYNFHSSSSKLPSTALPRSKH